MDTNVWRIEQAVNAYDERLFFQRNEQTGDWCVYIRMPSPEPPYPVIGFGTEIPALDDVMYRIQKADSMKHGNQIYADMIKSQREYRNNLDKMAAAASTEAAEPVEFLMRKHGKSPVVKVFYNSKGGAASDD
jgi:hypothetical protein